MPRQTLEYHREWRAKNREKDKSYNRKSYAKNRTKILERKRIYYRKATRNPISEKSRSLKFHYGLSIEAYNLLFCLQGGQCSICGASPNKKKSLAVDHNHSSGEVRELLCDNCNTGIGKFKHDPKLLTAAVKYLERWG